MTAADVRGLAAFARERGGTVVLLLEQADAGLAASLTGVTGWTPWSEATTGSRSGRPRARRPCARPRSRGPPGARPASIRW
ncbi:MAG: hypothetical protein R2752_02525 [Vicinamibacterales bacterium]